MSEQNGDDGAIKALLVDEMIGISVLPDGNIALVLRSAEEQIGIVLSPSHAKQAEELLASVGALGEPGPQ